LHTVATHQVIQIFFFVTGLEQRISDGCHRFCNTSFSRVASVSVVFYVRNIESPSSADCRHSSRFSFSSFLTSLGDRKIYRAHHKLVPSISSLKLWVNKPSSESSAEERRACWTDFVPSHLAPPRTEKTVWQYHGEPWHKDR
jgi:hypothetical protein